MGGVAGLRINTNNQFSVVLIFFVSYIFGILTHRIDIP